MMFLFQAFSFLAIISCFARRVQALPFSPYQGFGGVNHRALQFLEPKERDEAIAAMDKANVRVIRLFIRGHDGHFDLEPALGEFDLTALDALDDTLASIHRISKGKTKVVIAPHDIHSLRGDDALCDAYCQAVGRAWLDFYTSGELRRAYKNRLTVIFNRYISKNFGIPWAQLEKVILGVDLQNEPWGGVFPIWAGEAWMCDIANHLKNVVGLGQNGIAVISGGISGAQSRSGVENFPDAVWKCDAIDVIGIHG